MPKFDVDDAVYPDIILPLQHTARVKQLTSERRLMIAVLDDAIQCWVKHRCATDDLGRRLFAEESAWFLSEDVHSPYSFKCICDALDLDSGAVRGRLRLTAIPPSGPELCLGDFTEAQPRDGASPTGRSARA